MSLGSAGALDSEGRELPRLVYVAREKRPRYQDHRKAGAMNSLVCSLNFKYLVHFQLDMRKFTIKNCL